VWRLARDSASLDLNSPYCYLLLCSHFADTSLVAEERGEIVGFVAAYRPPIRPDSIFVWQIAVAASHRGAGLASRLLAALVAQPAVRDVRQLEATVTPSNDASRRLFLGFARRFGVPCREESGFPAQLFPLAETAHEAEILLCIGPLAGTGSDTEPLDDRTEGRP
jgi:L-2,4-diaminobutyric acid acetyltransferase